MLVTIEPTKTKEFNNILNAIKQISDFADFKNGKIKQRGTNRGNALCADLTSIVGEDFTLSIADIEKFIKYYNVFCTEDRPVIIRSDDDFMYVGDGTNEMSIRKGYFEVDDLKYMDDDKMPLSKILNPDNKLFEFNLTALDKKRILVICDTTGTSFYKIDFNGDTKKAKFVASDNAGKQTSNTLVETDVDTSFFNKINVGSIADNKYTRLRPTVDVLSCKSIEEATMTVYYHSDVVAVVVYDYEVSGIPFKVLQRVNWIAYTADEA